MKLLQLRIKEYNNKYFNIKTEKIPELSNGKVAIVYNNNTLQHNLRYNINILESLGTDVAMVSIT